jgi:hypothetical protein
MKNRDIVKSCVCEVGASLIYNRLSRLFGGFVHPATLLGHRSVFFTQREPEAKGAITNRQFRCRLQTLPFELLEQFAPRLSALPVAVNDSQ